MKVVIAIDSFKGSVKLRLFAGLKQIPQQN